MSRPVALLLLLLLPLLAAVPALAAEPTAAPPERITPLTIQQAELELKTAQLRLESLKLELASARQREAEASQQLEWMKGSLDAATNDAQRKVLREALEKQQRRLAEIRAQRKDAEDNLTRLQARLPSLENRIAQLRSAYAEQQEAALMADLKRLEERSAREIADLNRRIEALRNELRKTPPEATEERALLEARIDAAENRIFVTQTRLKLASARSAFDHLASINRTVGRADIDLLAGDLQKLGDIRQDLAPVVDLLERKLDLVQSQRQVLQQKIAATQLSGVTGARIDRLLQDSERLLREQLKEALALRDKLEAKYRNLTDTYRRLLNEDLAARERLPDTPNLWQSLGQELLGLPAHLHGLLQDQYRLLRQRLAGQPRERILGALLMLLVPLLAGVSYHYRMRGTRRRALAAQTFSARISAIALHVLRGISIPGALLIGLGGSLWLLGADTLLQRLTLLVLGIWVAVRLLRDLSYWFLVSPLVPAGDSERRLYRYVGINVWVSGLLGLMVGLGRLQVISHPLAVLADRLFMLSLLPAAYLGFRLRSLVIARLQEHGTTAYWLWVVRMISLLVPLAMLGIALPGLAGYINLASLVAWYLIATLLVAIAWLVLRGLLGDVVDRLGAHISARRDRGKLWYEGLVRPLHRVVRLLLSLLALYALFRIYGLGEQSTLLELARTALRYPLFTVGGTTIDPAHLLLALAVAVGAFPAGSWMRRLSFDWLYAGVVDRGVRNSLAVFTQYVTVLLGLLLAVNLLGIDLTSLAVFAGALGVGIGFGLQNIANNFISGLILLAERPIRVGDWVTVGSYEGEITYIGIRSATVRTWDNQEVIIPNAELVSNAFTNWTRSDPVVRTVLYVGVSYDGDPRLAQKVIEEAVTMQPEVLLQPAPRILLYDFADSSVNFRVQYYIDVSQFSRLEIKSKVMFAIWDALAEADIEIPFPQRDVHIRELPPLNGRAPADATESVPPSQPATDPA